MSPRIRPDHERLGGIDWLERTNGALTGSEKRRLLGRIATGQAQALASRFRLMTGRRPDHTPDIGAPPDSELARAAEHLCSQQPAPVIGHSYRTWVFGRSLAALDNCQLDDELFYVACLLHDAGLTEAVPGEDFTLRSGQIARQCAEPHLDGADVRHVQDAISAHCTPGATIERDGAESFYIQSGAVLDLGGVRLDDLSADFVDQTCGQHPRVGLTNDICGRIKAEAGAVPHGRFALLNKAGFLPAVRYSPFGRS